MLKFENKLQYNLPSGKKRGFAESLARKSLFNSAMFFYVFCLIVFAFVRLSSVERSDTDLYQDKHTFNNKIVH